MARLSQDVKNRIIEHASGIFSRFGLFKTTIDDIAGSLRMGKSSLYYYFKNKEELYKAVIETEAEIVSSRIKAAVDAAASPQEKLKVYCIMRMRCLQEMSNMYSALREEYLNPYGFIQEIRKDYDRRELALVTKILQEGVDKKVFAIKDAALTATAVITALRGLEYEWSISGKETHIEDNIDKLHNILLYGIMKK